MRPRVLPSSGCQLRGWATRSHLEEVPEGSEDQLHLEDVAVDPHRRSRIVAEAELQHDSLLFPIVSR